MKSPTKKQEPGRQTFLSLALFAVAGFHLLFRRKAYVRVSRVHVGELEFEQPVLEIVGASATGDALLPDFDVAFIRELESTLRISVLPANVIGLEAISGSGLFSVVVSIAGVSSKYRLWNYLPALLTILLHTRYNAKSDRTQTRVANTAFNSTVVCSTSFSCSYMHSF